MSLHTTASQTVGPFFRIGLEPMYIPVIAGPEVPGEHVTIRGRVLDGDGNPVPDAVIETWQADAEGRYATAEDAHDAGRSRFLGFGRAPTDEQGVFSLTTIKPGRVPGPDGGSRQAPHLVVLVFMRGLLRHLVTRMYFPCETANDDDPVLRLVPPERRQTLIAQPSPEESGVLLWDIHLHGDDETVFFDA